MSGLKLIQSPAALDKADSLAMLDKLRASIESGETVGFYGVSVAKDDQVASWSCSVGRVSRLRMMGAVSYLLACMHSGDA